MRSIKTTGRAVHFISISLFCVLTTALLSGCSLPSLETPQCVAARDTVKQFYSFYFANDMNSVQGSSTRSSFLTNELSSQLAGPMKGKDYFTASETMPKTFRVGACSSESADTATLDVVLLWHDDASSAQKEIKVEVVQRFGKWLINKVSG